MKTNAKKTIKRKTILNQNLATIGVLHLLYMLFACIVFFPQFLWICSLLFFLACFCLFFFFFPIAVFVFFVCNLEELTCIAGDITMVKDNQKIIYMRWEFPKSRGNMGEVFLMYSLQGVALKVSLLVSFILFCFLCEWECWALRLLGQNHQPEWITIIPIPIKMSSFGGYMFRQSRLDHRVGVWTFGYIRLQDHQLQTIARLCTEGLGCKAFGPCPTQQALQHAAGFRGWHGAVT